MRKLARIRRYGPLFYRESWGRYDVVLGEKEPLIYPVPWSRDHSTSFLLTSEEMRLVLERTGFQK